ncbi:hypothetical protein PCE1_003283 [Barthelona sp. PCE]
MFFNSDKRTSLGGKEHTEDENLMIDRWWEEFVQNTYLSSPTFLAIYLIYFSRAYRVVDSVPISLILFCLHVLGQSFVKRTWQRPFLESLHNFVFFTVLYVLHLRDVTSVLSIYCLFRSVRPCIRSTTIAILNAWFLAFVTIVVVKTPLGTPIFAAIDDKNLFFFIATKLYSFLHVDFTIYYGFSITVVGMRRTQRRINKLLFEIRQASSHINVKRVLSRFSSKLRTDEQINACFKRHKRYVDIFLNGDIEKSMNLLKISKTAGLGIRLSNVPVLFVHFHEEQECSLTIRFFRTFFLFVQSFLMDSSELRNEVVLEPHPNGFVLFPLFLTNEKPVCKMMALAYNYNDFSRTKRKKIETLFFSLFYRMGFFVKQMEKTRPCLSMVMLKDDVIVLDAFRISTWPTRYFKLFCDVQESRPLFAVEKGLDLPNWIDIEEEQLLQQTGKKVSIVFFSFFKSVAPSQFHSQFRISLEDLSFLMSFIFSNGECADELKPLGIFLTRNNDLRGLSFEKSRRNKGMKEFIKSVRRTPFVHTLMSFQLFFSFISMVLCQENRYHVALLVFLQAFRTFCIYNLRFRYSYTKYTKSSFFYDVGGLLIMGVYAYIFKEHGLEKWAFFFFNGCFLDSAYSHIISMVFTDFDLTRIIVHYTVAHTISAFVNYIVVVHERIFLSLRKTSFSMPFFYGPLLYETLLQKDFAVFNCYHINGSIDPAIPFSLGEVTDHSPESCGIPYTLAWYPFRHMLEKGQLICVPRSIFSFAHRFSIDHANPDSLSFDSRWLDALIAGLENLVINIGIFDEKSSLGDYGCFCSVYKTISSVTTAGYNFLEYVPLYSSITRGFRAGPHCLTTEIDDDIERALYALEGKPQYYTKYERIRQLWDEIKKTVFYNECN